MPHFDVDQLRSGDPYSWAYVVSVMLFPDDERARHASEHAFGAHALKKALAALLSAGDASARNHTNGILGKKARLGQVGLALFGRVTEH